MMTIRPSRAVLTGCCVLLMSSGATGLPSAWSESKVKPNPCTVLTEADFKKATGTGFSPYGRLIPEEFGRDSMVCHYSGAGGVDVEVILGPGYPKENFEKVIKKEERVTGIGDVASLREQRGQVALEALVGQYSMRLGLQSDGVQAKPLKEIAVELAKAAAAKLR